MLKESLHFFSDELNEYLILKKMMSSVSLEVTPASIASVCHAETCAMTNPNDIINKDGVIIKSHISIFNHSFITI